MTDDLIERVARAITTTDYLGSSEQGRKAYVEERWRDYEESARAAIAAMPGADEIERLRDEVEHWKQARAETLAGGDVLRAEIERLRERIKEMESDSVISADAAGWVLVPREATLDMSIAFGEAFYRKRRAIDDDDISDWWSAMLAAAPKLEAKP